MEELAALRAANQLYAYNPTEKQKEFHANPNRLRLFMAANQSGKTYSAGMEDRKSVV